MIEYIVGLRFETRSEVLTIEAEDALIAALKVKHDHPQAVISYVRKSNQRGDRRHPHRKEWRAGRSMGEQPVTPNSLQAMLNPFPANRMACFKIGTKIGNPKYDEPSLIEPIES